MRYAVLGMAAALCYASVAIAPTPSHAMAVFRHGTTLNWYASWTASPFLGSDFPPAIFAPSVDRISGQTVRQLVTISHGGSEFRVHFSNEFGTTPLHIGAASAGHEVAGHLVRVRLTFGGADSIVAYAGAPVVSDPVSANLADGANLEVSLYLPDPTPVSTIHLLGLQPSIISGPGNYVMSDALPGASPFTYDGKMGGQKFEARLFLSEVDVAGSEPVKTVVAFGDSITDGMGSTPDSNHRWPDELAQRIAAKGLNLSVVNAGIGGNQVLANGLGIGALGRLDRDALSLPGVSEIILMEGINDIGFSQSKVPGMGRPDLISAEAITQGYRQLIARAHPNGVRVIGATMTPFAGSPAYTEDKEKVREAVNEWIRTSNAFDAIIDFDAVVRDPKEPEKLKAEYASVDHIHLNDAGYKAMAAAIDLSTLQVNGVPRR